MRIGSHFSSWLEVLLGVPQGSILGPLLFNIFINDLLFIITDISNFADDNTLSACESNMDKVLEILTAKLDLVLEWFNNNSMVANPSKFQLIFPGTVNANIAIKIGKFTVKSVEIVKLLGVKFDSKLSFVPHVKELCRKSDQIIRALRRIRHLLPRKKADLLVNAYILSPFNYCPFVWMFCGKEGNRLIEQSHCRALRVLLNESDKSYQELLLECNTVALHTRNLLLMVTEVYKSLNRISPEIMLNIFTVKHSKCSLRSGENL